jgi:hypothetical protein
MDEAFFTGKTSPRLDQAGPPSTPLSTHPEPSSSREKSALLLLPALFALTLFFSATLLFWSQPLIGKMLLPLLGGSPSVWNVCLLFFQATLLAGYLYAHFMATRVRWNVQALIHLPLVGAAILVLPITISDRAAERLMDGSEPHLWLLATLMATAGLPLLALSTTAPLLQNWFARLPHPWSKDPYFLYAASNSGSLAALLMFPLILEPFLRIQTQAVTWLVIYGLFALCLAACALTAGVNRAAPTAERPRIAKKPAPLPAGQRLRWMTLAFVPSSLMLGTTTYLTSDVASAPLLWIIPLSLYLLTFVLVFARRPVFPETFLRRSLPIAAVAISFLWLTESTHPALLILPLHLIFFWMTAHYCHGKLAQARPGPERLTEFYLALSLGGVLGGIFNAIIAPLLFTALFEYPIAIVAAMLLLKPGPASPSSSLECTGKSSSISLGEISPAVREALCFVKQSQAWHPLAAVLGIGFLAYFLGAVFSFSEGSGERWLRAFCFGVPLLLCFLLSKLPSRFAFGLGAIFVAALLTPGGHGKTLWAERNFYGIVRVTLSADGKHIQMIHGNTIHGKEFREPEFKGEPLSYYHRQGPFGQIMEAFQGRASDSRIAVIGLGAGNMLAYARPEEHWTFYEINPAVVRAARNEQFFSFLQNDRSASLEIIMGDARLQLRQARHSQFDLIILDAFSSDAIPLHLLTREALRLYLDKLADDGMLAFHISNRTLKLEPVLADLAGDLGLLCLAQDDMLLGQLELAQGMETAHWVVMAREPDHFGRLYRDGRWLRIPARDRARVWTDDFSNLLRALR